MKKQFSSKEVKAIFKQLEFIYDYEIRYHKKYFYDCNNSKKLDDAQEAFIDGYKYAKCIIKNYFENCLRDLEEDEFIVFVRNLKYD